MSAAANKQLVQRYIQRVLNEGEINLLDSLVTPGYCRHAAPQALTLDEQKQRLAAVRAAFPDIHFSVDDLIAEGDRVVFRTTLRGTHSGPFLGVPPRGRTVAVEDIGILRLENGLIAEHWGGPNLHHLRLQIEA